MKRIISLALCFMLVFTLSPSVFAASDITWTGAVDSSWHTPGNWNPAQVPGDGDYVIIPESSVVEYVYDGETSVRLVCAGNLTVSGGTLKFASGNSSLTNGKLDGAGDIEVTAGGNFSWSGGTIVGSGKIIVDQNANFYATSGPLDRYLVNNGSLLICGDSLTLTGGAEGNGNFSIQQDNTLELRGNKSYNLSKNLCNMGVLRISNACTSVSLSSGYTQQSTGTLRFDIGGPSDFTKLGVTGQAILNGELKLNISDGYGPSLGDTFEIMTYGSRTGIFSSITSSIDGIAFEPTYTDTNLTLTVKQVGPPSAPRNFTATPGDGQVALSWEAPTSNGGAAILGYQVSKDSGVTWGAASTNTSHTFTGLTNGTEYTFKVRAFNNDEDGAEASATATPAVYVCEIGVAKYATLDAALTAVTSGQTIKLLNSITHTSPIEVDGKTIYFELGNYDLLVDTSSNPDDSIYSIVTVKNGGKIRLAGTGTGKFNVKSSSSSHHYGIRVLDANSEVTVNNVDITGAGTIGVYMYGSGPSLDGGTITVNGHLNAGSMGVDVNAKNGNVVINGDITSGHTGVRTATNPGTSVTVNGNITVLGTTSQNLEGAGIHANGKTTVNVAGDVTGQGANYIGVYALGGTITVGGNVVSSGIGAKAKPNYSYGNGAVTIDGSLSAGTPFIIVGTTEKATADITDPTTKTGFLTYSDGISNVWIGSIGAPVITAPSAPRNFTATPGDGQVALSWTAPTSDGGAAITRYEVSKDSGVTWVTASTNTSHTFTGLTNGTAYTFKARAVNSAGNGAEASATATPAVCVCEIGVAKYATLDAALAAVTSGQTIKLLNNITHTSPIEVDGKTIYFELGDYNLLVDTSDNLDVSISGVLTVKNGGKLKRTGVGAGKLNVKSTSNSHEYGIRIFGANSEVTVNNVNVTGEGATGVYAKGGIVVINEDITADHRGVVTAVVADTSVTVNGNITVLGNAPEGGGIYADEKTTVCVTGDVTGHGTDCIGVFADGGTIRVCGNVASSGIGAKAHSRYSEGKGEVTIDGSLSVATPFVVVGTTEKTAADITEPTTKTGFLTYSDGVNNVWIGSVGKTAPTAPQSFTATPGDGQVALSWEAPASDGGADISRYEVSKDSGATWGTAAASNSHTFTGLTNGTEYTFKARAVNSAGNGAEASATATPTAAPAPTYIVTVTNGTGGGEFAQGVSVTITANPAPDGQQFKEWQVISGGITLVNSQEASTSFQMPANAVAITAAYEPITETTYTVTVNGSYAATTGAGSYAQGATVTISAGSRSSYTFAGWTSLDGVTFTNANNATTTFTMPDKDVTITANWSYKGSSGGSSGGSSTPTTPTAPAYKADVKAENGTETTLPVTVDKDTGIASVDAGSQGLEQGGTIITIPSVPDVDTYSVGIPVPDLSTSDVQRTLTVNTDAGSVTVLSNMLTGVSGISGSKAQITIGQGDKDNLPDAVKAAIGGRPLVQLTLSIDGKRTDWSNPDAPVTVSIPYTPTAAELANPESIVVWYIDGSGNAVSVPNGHYDPSTGMVTFDTTHFSDYAVAYNKVSFKDVSESAWYSKAVGFISAREITTGTGGGNFSPEARLTRGQFIVMLMKAYDIAPDANPKDNFSDAGGTYYTGYLAAAKRLGISAGIGNNMFAPEKEITRQEMFTLLYNALKVIGQLPQGDSDKTLDHFSDAGQIDSWAKEAMRLLVKTGTIGGNAGKLNPTSTTTRAEMAQVLYNLLSK